jgi:hypothetical protein
MTNNEFMPTRESRDRFFVAKIDGQEKLFVLHSDHSICIASVSGLVIVEVAEKVLSEFIGLAA